MPPNFPSVSVSIVVPVYNVESFVGRCLDSIFAQTYSPLECIVVDDCGTDASMDIVRERLANYRGNISFKILRHEKNRGLSAARNTGAAAAGGDYVYFLDSDDMITPDCIAQLAAPLRERRVDFVLGNYASGGEHACFLPVRLPTGFLDGNEKIRASYFRSDWFMMAWNKLVSRDFLNREKLQFCEGLLHEDNLWSFQLACTARSMCVVNALTYVYTIRGNSITTAKTRKNLDALARIVNECECFARERGIADAPDVEIFLTQERERLLSAARNYGISATWKIYKTQIRPTGFSLKKFRALSPAWKARYVNHLFPAPLGFAYALFIFKTLAIVARRFRRIAKIARRAVNFARSVAQVAATFANARKGKSPRIIFVGSPLHGNLGDHAIALATLEFFKKHFNEHTVVEIPGARFVNLVKRIPSAILRLAFRGSDTVAICGGGFLGTLWLNEEEMVRDAIKFFQKNRTVIFPQTVFYEKTARGNEELARSREIYLSHKDLQIFLRDRSVNFARENFAREPSPKICVAPDIVLSLDRSAPKFEREGALLCFRSDKEKTVRAGTLSQIESALETRGISVEKTDTVISHSVSEAAREVELERKFDEFRRARIVITDRLHGMIFATITGTPCIALNNSSGKVEGVWSLWLRDNFSYVKFVGTAEDVPAVLDEMLALGAQRYDASVFETYWNSLAKALKPTK